MRSCAPLAAELLHRLVAVVPGSTVYGPLLVHILVLATQGAERTCCFATPFTRYFGRTVTDSVTPVPTSCCIVCAKHLPCSPRLAAQLEET